MLILPEDVRRERLISDGYRAQQTALHENPDYGTASVAYAPIVAKICNQHRVGELLDYGAGKGRLAQTIMDKRMVDHPMRFQHYDPAIPGWDSDPEPCEMVACIDVLEHIEPDLLDNVLDDLQRLTKHIAFLTVTTVPAMKVLNDGRNAHLIVQEPEWWLPQIMRRFDLHIYQKVQDGFFVLMTNRDQWRLTPTLA